jgi:hypothetical protein
MPCGKVDQLAGHDLVQPVDAGDAVAERDDGADLVDLDALLVVLNLLAKQLGNLVCLNLCHALSFPSKSVRESGSVAACCYWAATMRWRNCRSCARTEPSYTVEPIRTTAPPSREASSL